MPNLFDPTLDLMLWLHLYIFYMTTINVFTIYTFNIDIVTHSNAL